jgi:hypothetical protein
VKQSAAVPLVQFIEHGCLPLLQENHQLFIGMAAAGFSQDSQESARISIFIYFMFNERSILSIGFRFIYR